MDNGYTYNLIIATAIVRITGIKELNGEAEIVKCLGIMQGDGIEIPNELKRTLEWNEPAKVWLNKGVIRHILPTKKNVGDEIIVYLLLNVNPRKRKTWPFVAFFVVEKQETQEQIGCSIEYAEELIADWIEADPQKQDSIARQAAWEIIEIMQSVGIYSDINNVLHNLRNAFDGLRYRIAQMRKGQEAPQI